jgi:hypothetical protein
VPADLLTDPTWNGFFGSFIEERARQMFGLIERYAIAPLSEMAATYGTLSEIDEPEHSNGRDRLPEMIANGRIQIGERVYVAGYPDKVAIIVSSSDVAYQGRRLSINAWGQEVTGWLSINIYTSVYLERTGQPLKNLRQMVPLIDQS